MVTLPHLSADVTSEGSRQCSGLSRRTHTVSPCIPVWKTRHWFIVTT